MKIAIVVGNPAPASRTRALAEAVGEAVAAIVGGAEPQVVDLSAHLGTAFDPALVDLFCEHAPSLLGDLDAGANWDAVIAAEPQLGRRVAEDRDCAGDHPQAQGRCAR